MLVATSDRGFFDTFKEAGALVKHLAAARKETDSELIREAAETKGTGFGFTDSPKEIEAETLDALRSTVTVLSTKAPDELDAYRGFVLGVARSVSDAPAAARSPRRPPSPRSARRWGVSRRMVGIRSRGFGSCSP